MIPSVYKRIAHKAVKSGTLRITEIEFISRPKCCGEVDGEYSSVAQKNTTHFVVNWLVIPHF